MIVSDKWRSAMAKVDNELVAREKTRAKRSAGKKEKQKGKKDEAVSD